MAKTKTKKKKQAKKTSKKKQSQPQAKAAKAKAKKKMTRIEASVIALSSVKGRLTIEQAIQNSDEIYVDAGGQSNFKEARYSFRRAALVMHLSKMIKIEDGYIHRLS